MGAVFRSEPDECENRAPVEGSWEWVMPRLGVALLLLLLLLLLLGVGVTLVFCVVR